MKISNNIIFVSVLCTSFFSYADNQCDTVSCSEHFTQGPYVGIDIGFGWLDMSDFQVNKGVSSNKSNDGVTRSLNIGYLFPINDQFSIGPEIGYETFFNSPDIKFNRGNNSASIKVEDALYFPIYAVTQYQLTNDVYLFTKLGAAYVRQKTSVSSNAINIAPLSDTQTSTDWRFAGSIGIGYALQDYLGLSIHYTYIDGDNSSDILTSNETQPYRFQNVGMGITFSF